LDNNKKDGVSKFARLSGVGIQMGVIIALFTWLGTYIDASKHSKIWTIVLSLTGVLISLVIVIREVIKMGKEDE
jgi:hypothetical protein